MPVAPCTVGKGGNYKLYSMTLILTIGDYLLERDYLLRKFFFARFAEVQFSVFIPVNRTKDYNGAVYIVELSVIFDIFLALSENLCRNISVESLISRHLKIVCARCGSL